MAVRSELIADGTRALTTAGRWRQAAEHARAHRGTGERLLDGRQATILALISDDRIDLAAQLTEQATAAEPWEHTVQAILRVLCQHAAGRHTEPDARKLLAAAHRLAQDDDLGTVASRTRTGLVALEITSDYFTAQRSSLLAALIANGRVDGYAARDLLTSRQAVNALTNTEHTDLQTLVLACGLDAGSMPACLYEQVSDAAGRAETILAHAMLASASDNAYPGRAPRSFT